MILKGGWVGDGAWSSAIIFNAPNAIFYFLCCKAEHTTEREPARYQNMDAKCGGLFFFLFFSRVSPEGFIAYCTVYRNTTQDVTLCV